MGRLIRSSFLIRISCRDCLYRYDHDHPNLFGPLALQPGLQNDLNLFRLLTIIQSRGHRGKKMKRNR